jgi:hypothetical protein
MDKGGGAPPGAGAGDVGACGGTVTRGGAACGGAVGGAVTAAVAPGGGASARTLGAARHAAAKHTAIVCAIPVDRTRTRMARA